MYIILIKNKISFIKKYIYKLGNMNKLSVDQLEVYQKHWASATLLSPFVQLKTPCVGSNFVVTFSSKRLVALANIDENIHVESMKVIFERFNENSIELKTVGVFIAGGWKKCPQSLKLGTRILKFINDAGFEDINIKMMFLKTVLSYLEDKMGVGSKDREKYYYHGVMIDVRDGETYIYEGEDKDIDSMQACKLNKFEKKHALFLDRIEIPISETKNI